MHVLQIHRFGLSRVPAFVPASASAAIADANLYRSAAMTRRRRLHIYIFAALRRRAGRDGTSSLGLPNLPNA